VPAFLFFALEMVASAALDLVVLSEGTLTRGRVEAGGIGRLVFFRGCCEPACRKGPFVDASLGDSAADVWSLAAADRASSCGSPPGLIEAPYFLPALPYVVNLFLGGKPNSVRVAIIRVGLVNHAPETCEKVAIWLADTGQPDRHPRYVMSCNQEPLKLTRWVSR